MKNKQEIQELQEFYEEACIGSESTTEEIAKGFEMIDILKLINDYE